MTVPAPETLDSPTSTSIKPESDSGIRLYHDIARVIERMHRRFLDVVRIELTRRRIHDVSPVQVLMLLNIQGEELTVRDLIERGYYLGSNASYNLKQLVEAGYVMRAASQRDKRAAHLTLSDKGRHLCQELSTIEEEHARSLIDTHGDVQDFETTFRTLRRLERRWSDFIQTGGKDLG
ncbi:Exopolysaccharide II synthesis transcriptional activator ExpG [Azospirillaceae bacterium]